MKSVMLIRIKIFALSLETLTDSTLRKVSVTSKPLTLKDKIICDFCWFFEYEKQMLSPN